MLVDEDRIPIRIEDHKTRRIRRGIISRACQRETTLFELPLYVPNVVKVR